MLLVEFETMFEYDVFYLRMRIEHKEESKTGTHKIDKPLHIQHRPLHKTFRPKVHRYDYINYCVFNRAIYRPVRCLLMMLSMLIVIVV